MYIYIYIHMIYIYICICIYVYFLVMYIFCMHIQPLIGASCGCKGYRAIQGPESPCSLSGFSSRRTSAEHRLEVDILLFGAHLSRRGLGLFSESQNESGFNPRAYLTASEGLKGMTPPARETMSLGVASQTPPMHPSYAGGGGGGYAMSTRPAHARKAKQRHLRP